MSLATFMIGTTFLLGVVLVLVGGLAGFRRHSGAGGKFSFAGISIEGRNGATMLLGVGAAFVTTGFGWATTQNRATTAETSADRAKIEVEKADADLTKSEQQRSKLYESLKANVPPERLQAIERESPGLRESRTWHPPADLVRTAGARRVIG